MNRTRRATPSHRRRRAAKPPCVFLLLALGALLLPFAASPAGAAVFIVRHGEKQSESNEKDVALSAAGAARAARLAGILRDAHIAAIYSTDTVRTLSTAEPLAKAAKLQPILYSPSGADGKVDLVPLAERILRDHPRDNVLVVGHSNTVGPLVQALGAREPVAVAGSEYDGLWIVVPGTDGRPADLLRLRQ